MGKMPHIQLDESIQVIGAILPGDPARVDVIAQYLDDVREEGFNREYKSITGTYKGRRILAMSTGMGGASMAIGVEELADLGVRDMIRIGSCGALQNHVRLGELIICDKAVCDDGASQTYAGVFHYASQEWNAAYKADHSEKIVYAYADPALTAICKASAVKMGIKSSIGPTRSHDALYQKIKPELDAFYSERGVCASDMETAALYAVGAVRGVRTCSILNVVVEWQKDIKEGVSSYKEGEDLAAQGERNEIILALETLVRMQEYEK